MKIEPVTGDVGVIMPNHDLIIGILAVRITEAMGWLDEGHPDPRMAWDVLREAKRAYDAYVSAPMFIQNCDE